ncbi:hypothetical protein LguiB_034690 [Lonicera macranthoides]
MASTFLIKYVIQSRNIFSDASRVKSKMVFASSKDRFKKELHGIQFELQATDPSEMSLDIGKQAFLAYTINNHLQRAGDN